MDRLKRAFLWLVITAIVLLVGSWFVVKPGPREFGGNIFQNLFAEIVGLILTVGAALYIAKFLARKKLEKLATPLAELIAQLRAENRISPHGARRSMVFAVEVITPEYMSQVDNNAFCLDYEKKDCEVCDLEIKLSNNKCDYCKLERHIWEIKNKPVISSSTKP